MKLLLDENLLFTMSDNVYSVYCNFVWIYSIRLLIYTALSRMSVMSSCCGVFPTKLLISFKIVFNSS